MSEELVVRCCAPTIASLKTGNMFNCRCDSETELYAQMRSLNRRLGRKGLRVLPLRYRGGTALVYLYRPGKLREDLEHATACALLNERGYPCGNANRCVRSLMARLAREDEFPHEIGLFLGYPPEDVEGFIHRRGEEKWSGCWKVYSDVASAQKTVARYRKCTDVYLRALAGGRTLERLAVAR